MGKNGETVGRGKRSSVVNCTWRHSVKTSEGMFQWPLEDPEICQATPVTLIWCQSGGRNKIHTYQNEAFNSLAICPPTPPPTPTKGFPQLATSSHLTVTCCSIKKEKLLLDKIQQLSSNSWVGPGVGRTRGPEREQQQVGVKEKKWQFQALGWGCLRPILAIIRTSTQLKRQSQKAWQSHSPEC